MSVVAARPRLRSAARVAGRFPPPGVLRRPRLGDLLACEECVAATGPLDRPVSGLVTDCRRVVAGSVFFDVSPSPREGAGLDEAVRRGAVAVVGPRRPRVALGRGLTVVQVHDPLQALAGMALRFHGYPDRALRLLGISGPHGKTIVAHLLQHLLGGRGSAGLLSSIHADLGRRIVPASAAGQGPLEGIAWLAAMRDAGCGSAVVEVPVPDTSAGWSEGLSWAHRFRVGNDGPGDESGFTLTAGSAGELAGGPFGAGGVPARLPPSARPLLGGIGVALRAALHLGVEPERLASRLATLPPVPGRAEPIATGAGFTAWVDAADRPERLEHLLRRIRALTPRRLWLVFGCPGERAPAARPVATRVAQELADFAVATADNPREEGVAAVFADMRRGVRARGGIAWVEDRRAAITGVLGLARPGDAVVIAGRGEQPFQEIGRTVVPLDDREVVRAWARGRAAA